MFTADTLANRHILITGGGSGLGYAMAECFLKLGAQISICGRDSTKLETAAANLRQIADRVNFAQCDVRDHGQVDAMFGAIETSGGPVTDLINNAAGNFLCPSEDLTPNGFKSVIDIVLHGTFNCTHCFGKRAIAAGRKGSVLSIVTTYTETGSAFVLPSACAKAGVYALTTSLAYEWATYGIRVNAIAPGPFPTEGAWSRLVPDKKFEDVFRGRVPMGRFGTPSELANVAAFLLSDLAAYITGECTVIDGGERLNAGQFNFVTQLAPRAELKMMMKQMRNG